MNDEDDILNEFYDLVGEDRDYATKKEIQQINELHAKSNKLIEELLNSIDDEIKRKKISDTMEEYDVKIDEYYFLQEKKSFISGFEYAVKLMATLNNRNR